LASSILTCVAVALVACTGDDTSSPSPTPGTDSGAKDATAGGQDANGGTDAQSNPDTSTGDDDGSTGSDTGTDTGTDAPADAGPTVVTVPFDPTGTGSPDCMYWDDATSTLYVTDDNNAIWTWTQAAGLTKKFTTPNTSQDGAAPGKLNGITMLADGTLVVTQFGFGAFGGIFTVAPDGGVTQVPNVPAAGRRIMVVHDDAGVIYSDSFQKVGQNTVGVVETVDLANGTTPIASGFVKPVGLLPQGDNLLVVDQTANAIYSIPRDPSQLGDGGLADGAPYTVYASIPSPDQLTSGPNGSVFTDQFKPATDGGPIEVRQVFPDGGFTTVTPDAGFTGLSDVAYDATGHRLFVIDSNGTTVRTIKIFPMP
jgi:hypothetical protein